MEAANEFHADALPEAARRWQPRWGIVLGSGQGTLADELEISHSVSFADIPGVPISGVQGHAGRFLFTEISGVRVVIAQGRAHLYEGRSAREVTACVRCMAALDIRRLVLTNAAGLINPAFAPGGWMMISDHLNLTGTSPLLGGPNFCDMTEVYSLRLCGVFAAAAREEQMELPTGVYAGVTGPQYETPAEIRMLRALGADAVGMSTVLEAMQARALGLEVAAFSCLTNWAAGFACGALDHGAVLGAGRLAAGGLLRLLRRALSQEIAG